jgi:hypothetical protein
MFRARVAERYASVARVAMPAGTTKFIFSAAVTISRIFETSARSLPSPLIPAL